MEKDRQVQYGNDSVGNIRLSRGEGELLAINKYARAIARAYLLRLDAVLAKIPDAVFYGGGFIC